jgi:hypothetical protein
LACIKTQLIIFNFISLRFQISPLDFALQHF